MKNKIDDLRNHLFAQLEKLSDEDITDDALAREVSRATSVVQVAEVIVDTARAETEFLKVTTGDASDGSGFFPVAKEQRKYFIEKE